MNCSLGCTCGKHNQHHQHRSPRPRINNATIIPGRAHDSSTYGEEQAARVRRSAAERRAAGIEWHDRPSERFDWDAAIVRFRAILKEVYGQ